MTNNENKFKITAEDVLKKALENTASEPQDDKDDYPVTFDEGVDFMGTGIVVHNFGEVMGCCSESLMKRASRDAAFAFSIWDTVRRFLTGDFGDVSPELAKRVKADFHEGLPVLCKYRNYFIDEKEIWLGVDELGNPENPRFIYALLPSEQKAIEEWYERHSEERPELNVPYALFVRLH